MRYTSTTAMVLAAFTVGEAVAGPAHAAHAHFHQHRNLEKKGEPAQDWNNMGIDWEAAWRAGQTTTPAPAPATTAAAAQTTEAPKGAAFKEKAASAVQGIADDLKELFDGIVGASNSRSSFGSSRVLGGGSEDGAGLAGDFHNGNIGLPYGSNVIPVASEDGYDFTATFINTQSRIITINIWNKGGSDLQPLSGASLAPKDTSLTFTLSANGGKQVVAFDNKSYISWAEATDARSFEGSFATTWGEAKFEKSGCGYDVSAIKNPNGSAYLMEITAKEVTCKSSQDENYWLTDTQPIGDSNGSCYNPFATMHLTVKMGGKR